MESTDRGKRKATAEATEEAKKKEGPAKKAGKKQFGRGQTDLGSFPKSVWQVSAVLDAQYSNEKVSLGCDTVSINAVEKAEKEQNMQEDLQGVVTVS